MSKYKTIIFDFDGTLVNSDNLIRAIYSKLKDELGLKTVSSKQLKTFKHLSLQEKISLFNISSFKLPGIVKRVQEEMGKNLDKISWNPGMISLLKKIYEEDFQVGVLSSNSIKNLSSFFSSSQINYFDFVKSGKNLFGKDRDLQKLIKEKRLLKKEILYVGDEVRDIEACKKVGIDIAAVCWGFEEKELLKKHNPTYLVDEPKELLKIIS